MKIVYVHQYFATPSDSSGTHSYEIAKRRVAAGHEVNAVTTACDTRFVDLKELWANSAKKFFTSIAAGVSTLINYGGWQAELLASTGAGIRVAARAERSSKDNRSVSDYPGRRDAAARAAIDLACKIHDRYGISQIVVAAIVNATRSRSS